jgi:uncharacterized protein YraI
MLDQTAPTNRPDALAADTRTHATDQHAFARSTPQPSDPPGPPATVCLALATRRRWSALLAAALLVGALLPVGRAAAVPSGQISNLEATVNGDQDLNVRAGPGLDEPIVGSLPAGSQITILSGPVAEDGWNWCQHDHGGWSVCEPLITLQGVSVMYAGGGGGAAPPSGAAPVAAPAAPAPTTRPAASTVASTSANAPPRPQPPVQTAVSLPLPGGTPLIPSPTIRVAATPTIIAPRPATGSPTVLVPGGVAPGALTPGTGIPQPPPGLVPQAPSGVGTSAVGTPTPTPLVRVTSPVPPGPATGPQPIGPGGVPGQVAPGQVVPGQVVPGQVAPGQVPVAPGQVALTPGAVPVTPAGQPNFLPR